MERLGSQISGVIVDGKALQALGMTDAFTAGKADFSGMDGSRDLVIGGVVQKTFCAVDEDGTEAAAATAVVMRATSAPMGPPKDFVADHPFLFLIRDTKTGSILFMEPGHQARLRGRRPHRRFS